MTTIHLVGLCNDNPMLQQYFGCLSKRDFRTNEMVLNNIIIAEKCSVTKNGDRYAFEGWYRGHGVAFTKQSDNSWRFVAGLNCRDSGSSGILVNGGPEMEQFYKILMEEEYEKNR